MWGHGVALDHRIHRALELREQADAAAAQFAEIPECRAMSEHIAEILSFEHGLAAEPEAPAEEAL